jgi:Mg/Co/Ni transporter MgtE
VRWLSARSECRTSMVTTLVDATGLIIYFTTAKLLLGI